MATATVHIGSVGGYLGTARCFQLDPPKVFGDATHDYVTVVLQPQMGHQDAEVLVFPATPAGGVVGISMRKRSGSFTPDQNPATAGPDYAAGCFAWALLQLGGYTIADV